eukprot:COSAG03_NODE_23558_length_279_cov_0.572222_1_plen_53_part_10
MAARDCRGIATALGMIIAQQRGDSQCQPEERKIVRIKSDLTLMDCRLPTQQHR